MPSTSTKQRNYIFYLKGKYKNKSDTPEDQKWIWDSDWNEIKKEDCGCMKRYQSKFKENIVSELEQKFDMYNKKFFNDSLDIRRISVNKDVFSSSFIMAAYDYRNDEIYFNKNSLPIEVLNYLLLHEMIHVYNYQVENLDPLKDNWHGIKFEKIRKKLNTYLKYDIPIKENMQSLDNILNDLGI